MPNNQIKFDIKFNTDMTDMRAVQQNLQTLQNLKLNNLIDPTQFKDASIELTRINEVARITEQALQRTFDIDMGTANLRDFQQQLKNNGLTIGDVEREFLKLGTEGELAFMQVQRAVSGVNYELKTAHPLLDKIGKTLGNTIRYQIATTAINKFAGSIQSAYSFAKQLDTSLNNIRIVTSKSSDEMAKFAVQANNAAKALGASTTDYTNAALIYYQQGLSDAEVQARTDVTIKVANITKQSADAVSEELTAVWNGYKVTAEEAELYIDKLSAVAASSASDLEELATGMSKVASTAAAMGVSVDQLTAQLSAIISVTRQDANSVGNALKTIYARIGDLAIEGEDEFGVTLGDVSGKLQTMGVNVLDQIGNLRDMGEIIEEVAAKWGTWTEAQQQAAAVALAGKRQYNSLIALFENWDMYTANLATSKDSAGTLQKQQDIYLDSLEAHLEKVDTAAEKLYNSLFDSDSFKGMLDAFTFLIDKVGDFVDILGGVGPTLLYIGSLLTNIFSNQIGQFIGTSLNNIKTGIANRKNYNAELRNSRDLNKELKHQEEINTKAIALKKLTPEEQRNENTYIATTQGKSDSEINAFDYNLSYISRGELLLDKLQNRLDTIKEKLKIETEPETIKILKEQAEKTEKTLENLNNKIDETKKNIQETSGTDNIKKLFNDKEIAKAAENLEESQQKELFARSRAEGAQRSTRISKLARSGIISSDEAANLKQKNQQIEYLQEKKIETSYNEDKTNANNLKQIQEIQKIFNETDLIDPEKEVKEIRKLAEEFEKEMQEAMQKALKNGEAWDDEAKQKAREKISRQQKYEKVTEQAANVNQGFNKTSGILDKLNKDNSILQGLGTEDISKIAEARKNTEDLIKALKSIDKESVGGIEAFNDTFHATGEEAKKYYAILKPLVQKYGDLSNVQKLSNEEIKEEVTCLAEAAIERRENIEAIQNFSDRLKESSFLTDEEKQNIDELSQAAETDGNKLNELITLLSNKLAELRQTAEQTDIDVKKVFSSEGSTGIKDTTEDIDNLNKQLDDKKPQEFGKSVSQSASAIMSIGSVVSGVTGIINIFKDDTLSTGEKIKQSITGLIGLVPTIISAIIAIQSAAGPVMWIAMAIAAFIAAVVAAGIAISDSIDKQMHAAQYAAEDANEAYETQVAILEELKEAYENLKSSIEDYTEAQNAIDDLTEGTDEWKEAIETANEEVLKLLSTYSELANYINTDANGRLTISPEGLDAVLKEQKSEVVKQQQTTLIAQIHKNETAAAANKENIFNNGIRDEWTVAGALGSFLLSPGGLGLVAYGATKGAHKAESDTVEKNYDKIIEAINSNIDKDYFSNKDTFAQLLKENGITSQRMIDALWTNADAIKANAKEVKQNTIANLALERQVAASTLSGKSFYENTELKDIAQELTRKEANENYNEEKQILENKYNQDKKNKEKNIANDYALFMGEGYTSKDGKVYDADNNEVKISTDEMLEAMAQSRAYDVAAKNIEESFGDVEQRAKELNSVVDGLGHALLKASTFEEVTDYSEVTQNMINAIHDMYDSLSEEEKLGADRILTQYQDELNKIQYTNEAYVRDAFNAFTKDRNDLSLATQKNIAESLANAFKIGGSDAVDKASDFLSQYSGEELDKITEIFKNTDWTSGSDTLFRESLEAAGIELKNTDNIYNNLIASFKRSQSVIADVTSNWSALKTQLSEIRELTKDINIGDIIDEDDYKTLIKYNAELKDYFVSTVDGYKLIKGNAAEIEKIANKNVSSFEAYGEAIEAVNEQGQKLNDLNLNWDSNENIIPDLNTLETLLSGDYDEIIKNSGVSKEQLQEAYKFANADADVTEDNKKIIGEMLGLSEEDIANTSIENLQTAWSNKRNNELSIIRSAYVNIDSLLTSIEEGNIKLGDEQQQYLASLAESYDELREIRNTGYLEEENYQKVRRGFIIDDLTDLDLSITAWDAWAEKVTEAEQETALGALKAAAALEEIDIAAEVSNNINKLTNSLTKLQNQAEKTYNKDLINNLNQQAEIQAELIKAEQEKYRLLQEQVKIYEEAYKVQEAMIKARLNEYDVFTNGELDYEKISNLYISLDDEDLQEDIKQWMDAYQNFHDIEIDLSDQELSIQDAINDLYDTNIQKYNLTIELEIDIKQAERDFYEFMQKTYNGGLAEDDFAGVSQYLLKNALTYFDGGSGSLVTNMSALRDAMAALNAAENQLTNTYAGPYKLADGTIDTAAAQEAYEEYLEAAKDDAESLMDLIDEAVDNYISAMDDINDKFADQMENYTRIQSKITHDMNLIKLIYGETAYSKLEDYYTAQQQTYQSALQMATSTVDYWAETLSKISDKESEQYKHAQEMLQSSIEERDSMLEEALNASAEKYTNTVDAIVKSFIDGITGGDGLDLLNEKWEAANGQAERYLDKINASYQIQKLEAQFNDSIDDLKDNVNLQKRLNDLKVKELSYLKEKEKITQYDIDRATALYELELKKIELEEAQQNKVKLKLTRDANGNYSYQFTADEEATSSLAQEVADLENQLYNLDVEEYKSQTDNMLSAVQEFTDKIKNAYAISDELERNNMLEAIKEEYMGVNGVFKDIGMSMDTVTEHLNEFFASIGENPEDIIPGYGLIDDMLKQIADGSYYDELLDKLSNARQEMEEEQQNFLDTSNTQIGDSIKNNAEMLENIKSDNEKLIESAKAQTDAIESVIGQLDELQKKWQDVINDITEIEGIRLGISVEKAANESNPTELASGGYTGDWGSGGKLAVLHEKELVLNKDDTANMLNAMDILRFVIDKMAAAGSARANGLLDNIDMTGINNAEMSSNGTVIDQKVTIEANFPAATDREEIQAAFDNLINLAAQKAGTNNRR